MEKIIFSRAMSMNVTTYKILNDKGEQLVSLLQQFFDFFLKYIDQDLEIGIDFMNGKEKRMKMNDKNISKVYELLLQGKIECLDIFHYDDPNEHIDRYSDEAVDRHYPGLCSVGISCNLASTYSRELFKDDIFPNDFNLSISERLFDNYIPSHVQEAFVELFKKAVSLLEGDTGFITYETTATGSNTRTPFENHWAINTSTPPGYTRRIRGYFWLNYLSTHHMERLGGREYIRRNAPCAIIESLDQHDQSGMLLQLTDNINDYSDDQLRKLREFLWPVLDIENKYDQTHRQAPTFTYEPCYIVRLVE